MTNFVKLMTANRQKYIGANLYDETKISHDRSGFEMRLSGGVRTGTKHSEFDEALEDSDVKANQRVRIEFGSITPAKYHVEIVANPELQELIVPDYAFLRISPGSVHKVVFTGTARRSFKLDELEEHLLAIYLVE